MKHVGHMLGDLRFILHQEFFELSIASRGWECGWLLCTGVQL